MRSKQEVQLQLLQEIDEICTKNDLKYIMVEQKAVYAYLNRTLNDDYRMIAVAMTQGDIDRFCEIVINEKKEDRYVEGLFNNPKYLEFFVSYGNLNSADFDMVGFNRNVHKGIRIRIYPIKKAIGKDGTVYNGWNSLLLKERNLRNLLSKRVENEELWYLKTGLNVLNGAYSLSGSGSRYYNKIKKNIFIDKWEDIQQYSLVRIVNRDIDTKYLKGIEKIEIDGVELAYPENPKEFFANVFGEDFENSYAKPRKQKNGVISNTEISYNDIINETDDILIEARSLHEEIVLKRRKVKNEADAVRNVWRLVRMTEKQIEFQEYFDKTIDHLLSLNLDDETQFNEVYNELESPISYIKRYANYGMTFSINPKTDSLIEKVLLISGNGDLVKQINEISKREYFIE